MEFWQRIHWFATSDCNEKCRFCFKPEFKFKDSPERMRFLATTLIDNNVEEVIFTGGDPLLLKSLYLGLEILNEAGVDISIHTNATLLTENKLEDLENLVDEIAIPIDSLDRKKQKYLRRTDCLSKEKKVFKQLQNKKVRIGIHTVATGLNIKDIPKIYDYLNIGRFDYWKIYEYNPDLAVNRFSSVKRFKELERLRGKIATISNGGVNGLYADFLLMEEQMSKHNDKRIQFVGVKDYNRDPYFFLDTKGDVHFCTWFLQGKRKYLGNILKDGFKIVKKRIIQADAQGPLFDESSFIDTENDSPLWVRYAWEGNYFSEEIEEMDLRYHEKFNYLSRLYLDRLKRQGKIPETVELII